MHVFQECTNNEGWKIEVFNSPEPLVSYVRAEKPELLLMDIDLGKTNGIELVKQLHMIVPHSQVIFVSGHLEYCTSVYEVDHISFIKKPLEKPHFKRAIDKAIKKLTDAREKSILVRNRDSITHVLYDEVLYVENKGRKVRIQAIDRSLETYMAIEELFTTLDNRFVHCHKSYIVNMDYIKTLNKNRLQLRNGEVVFISQTRMASTKEAYLTYINQTLDFGQEIRTTSKRSRRTRKDSASKADGSFDDGEKTDSPRRAKIKPSRE
jgi:DNA-binding LytR/AlgR family response regulator